MQVTVKPLGYLKKFLPPGEKAFVVQLEQPLPLQEIFARCGIDSELAAMVMVNGKREKLSYQVKDGDEIMVSTHMAGG